jgi:hypothetical protein
LLVLAPALGIVFPLPKLITKPSSFEPSIEPVTPMLPVIWTEPVNWTELETFIRLPATISIRSTEP